MKSKYALPGFINESAAIGANGHLNFFRQTFNYSKQIKPSVYPSAEVRGWEVVEIFGSHNPCGAGDIQLGEGENSVCINPDTFWGEDPYTPPPQPPGGGGGGGYDSGGGTVGMDIECIDAASKASCRPGHPSPYYLCEVLKCRIEYCKGNDNCTASERQKAANAKVLSEQVHDCANKDCRIPVTKSAIGIKNSFSNTFLW